MFILKLTAICCMYDILRGSADLTFESFQKGYLDSLGLICVGKKHSTITWIRNWHVGAQWVVDKSSGRKPEQTLEVFTVDEWSQGEGNLILSRRRRRGASWFWRCPVNTVWCVEPSGSWWRLGWWFSRLFSTSYKNKM